MIAIKKIMESGKIFKMKFSLNQLYKVLKVKSIKLENKY